MNKHPLLGWPPPRFAPAEWHARLDETLATGSAGEVRRLARAIAEDPALPLRRIRVAVLRTFSLELLEDHLALAFARWGILPRFTWLDLGAFETELLDPDGRLRKAHAEAAFDVLLIAWRLKEWLPSAWESPPADGRLREVAAGSLERISGVLQAASRLAPSVCLGLDDHAPDAVTSAGRAAQDVLTAEHRAHLARWCIEHPLRTALLSLPTYARALGTPLPIADRKMDAFARQSFNRSAQVALAAGIAQACAGWFRAPAKVLVLDADNTLWAGTLSEDGAAGIHVDAAFPGSLHRQLQLSAKQLATGGTLLALASKNDLPDVEQLFQTRSDMPLAWDDFVAHLVSWGDKAEAIRQLATQLSLDLADFVFLDDSAFERANVRDRLPTVRVPETPDVLSMLDYLACGVDFLGPRSSGEDGIRLADYRARRQRSVSEAASQSRTEFLHSLGIEATIGPWSEMTLPRIAQLVQKTNQFNLTTRRHTLAQLETWFGSGDWLGWTLEARDRYGEQGIVAAALARGDGARSEWELDTFVLSCRALARGLETALLHGALMDLQHVGARRVSARYIATAKNHLVADFLPLHGAVLLSQQDAEAVYEFDLTSIVPSPEWITLSSGDPRNGYLQSVHANLR